MTDGFDADRYLIDQLIRPIANLYRVTPLAAGETPAGGPVAFVRQKKMAIKEDIRFYGDEQESQELFRIKARSMFDMGGSRYDVFSGEEKIGSLEHAFRSRCSARRGSCAAPTMRRSRPHRSAARRWRSSVA